MNPNAFFENNPEQAAASGYQGSTSSNPAQASAPSAASLQNEAILSDRGSLHVDALALRKLYQQLRTYVDGIFGTTLPSLKSSVHSLDATWEGDNHTRFMTYFDERMEAVMLHQKVLENYVDAFGQAVKVYSKLETDIEGRVSAMTKVIDSNIYYGDTYGNYD